MGRGTVLVIDDERDLVNLVRYNLELEGYEVLGALDGESGINLALSRSPDLILLDRMMPGSDGVEVCRRLRSEGRTAHVPVIMLTAKVAEEERVQGLDAGADDYVTKPASPENIRARLIIAERRIQQDIARRAAQAELARSRWLAGIGETTIALQHEINNPLTALLGHAELLLMDYKDRNESNEQVEVIFDQARRIADVVKRLGTLKDPESVAYIAGAKIIDLSQPGNEQR
jgi:DNA-binding response OmpR family regulator